MKYCTWMICLFLCMSCLSSCGVLSRARYGNGWKLNIESNLFARSAPKAAKKNPVRKYRDSGTETHMVFHPHKQPLVHASAEAGEGPEMVIPEKASLAKVKRHRKWDVMPAMDSRLVKYPDASRNNDYYVPVEPTVRMAAYLFYGGIIASFIPYINFIAYLAMTAGFILAIIGLRNLKLSDYAYRGYGLALSIVILYLLGLILMLFLLLILLALII